MYGPSDAGYQARLKKLTAQQQEWNATATAAHEAAQTELFKTGVAAKNNTADQTACIGKLLSDIQQNKELPLVLAVRRWTSGMMGRAAKAVHSHGYGIVFLGDCAEVVDLAGTKNRTSVCIAQHWLRGAFPDRKGQFKQKRDARDALAEEIKKKQLGRQVCFIDASVIGFSRYDWEEAEKVSIECDAVIVVSVDSQATATLPAVKKRKPRKSERATQPSSSQPSVRQRAEADLKRKRSSETVFPCLNQPEDSLARPRAHLRAQQAKAAAAAVPAEAKTLTQQLYQEIKAMLEDPADGSWNNIRKRQVDKLSAKVGELSQETQLTAQQTVRLNGRS